jgi:hypothetical protein
VGHEIHITRAAFWADNKGSEISAKEWLQLVESDPELRLAGYNGQYFALWSGQSRNPDPWFDWLRGNVSTKAPDPPVIGKAIALAKMLRARVQGDDGEIYLPNGQVESNGVVDTREGMDWRTW